MNQKDLFWQDVSSKLSETYILKSSPASWKKGEIEIFIEHFKKRVIDFRTLNTITPESDVKISYDTFRRILIKSETKGSDYTRDIFAQYFGEKSYLDYIRKLENSEPLDKNKILSATNYKTPIAVILGLVILFISGITFSQLNKEESACLEIRQVIEGAITAEMSAYKSVPDSDESIEILKDYFFVDQAAYKTIIRVINNEKKRNWILNNDSNISSAELIELDCQYVDDNLATITTKEHWNIQWFDLQIREYAYVYDTINTQIYYLKKSNDKWKISINDYAKTKDKIFVKLFNDDGFDNSLTFDEIKKKVVVFMSNGDTQSALWWLVNYAQRNSLSILDDFILLQGNLNSNIRRVNTNEIDISEYYPLNKEIDIKIFDLINSL